MTLQRGADPVVKIGGNGKEEGAPEPSAHAQGGKNKGNEAPHLALKDELGVKPDEHGDPSVGQHICDIDKHIAQSDVLD